MKFRPIIWCAAGAIALIAAAGVRAQWLVGGSLGNSQFIASVSLNANSFTAATPNASIGSAVVTMQPATPAFNANFPGSLTIIGPNTCGFYFSGTSIFAGANGCSATGGPHGTGIYDDWQIVASQPSGAKLIAPQSASAVAVVVGGAIPCDYGPPYNGAVPAAAQKAGFTRCAANYDFTYTGGSPPGTFTDTMGTHTWSNMPSWMVCSNTTTAPYLWKFESGGSLGCQDGYHSAIVTDANGVQNLQLAMHVADANASPLHSNQYQPVGNGRITGQGDGVWREEYYWEWTIGLDNVTPCGAGNFCGVAESSIFIGQQWNGCFTGTDMELDSPGPAAGGGLGVWNCTQGTNGVGNTTGHAPLFANGVPQTVGLLITGNGLQTNDGSSGFSVCVFEQSGRVYGLPASAWVSGGFNSGGCAGLTLDIPPDNGAGNPYSPSFTTYWCVGPCLGGTNNFTSDVVNHIYRWTLWECPNYDTPGTGGSQGCITNPYITSFP